MSNFSADSARTASQAGSSLESTIQQLSSESLKLRLAAVKALAEAGEAGELSLIDFLRSRPQPEPALGKAHQLLSCSHSPLVQSFLENELAEGIVPLISARSIDYSELQHLLVRQAYEAADRLTLQKLCELAGADAIKRKWVYFTEVDSFPIEDLRTIDQLWRIYSEDRFGFSQQREIWLSTGRSWDQLWNRLAWRSGSAWTRYPGEFVWDLSAPVGHLPLTNQLRGVRMMESLLSHPAWQRSD
ncbi:MAG: GUN4 domain-containing protein [Leptolyngbya sp. SIO4C1]|nr:GUN4 domain-containing protein [Leptolyngbya sp. SIO4C1]